MHLALILHLGGVLGAFWQQRKIVPCQERYAFPPVHHNRIIRLVFGDMAIYSMVKNNTFNGMSLPDIVAFADNGTWEVVKHFDYQDFKRRL